MFEIHPLFVFAGIMVCIHLLSLLQSSADLASLREQLAAERSSHNKTYARMIRAEQLLSNPAESEK